MWRKALAHHCAKRKRINSMTTYVINTPLRNYFFYKSPTNQVGEPLIDGYLIFQSAADHNTSLSVYSGFDDMGNPIPYPTTTILTNQIAVQLGGDGGIAPIYLQNVPYFIQCYSNELTLQWTIESYVGASFEPSNPIISGFVNNLVLDGQFTLGVSYNGNLPSNTLVNLSPANWYFEKDGTGGTDSLTFVPFALGDESVPATPINSLYYNMSVAESAGTYKYIFFPVEYVRSLESQQVTVSFYAQSATFSTVGLFYQQYFGTGGSPSATITVPVQSYALNGGWRLYTATFTVDSVAGETLGTDNNSTFNIGLSLPVNALVNFSLTNFWMILGNAASDYPYQIPQEVLASIPQSSPDYVSAGNFYYATGGATNNYVITTPNSPEFANPSKYYDGMKVRVRFDVTNTGMSSFTFLNRNALIKNAFNGLDVTSGQLVGIMTNYAIGYELEWDDAAEVWIVNVVPSSYTPVVIQNVVIPSNGTQISAAGAFNTVTPSSCPGSFAVTTFTPKSINSAINIKFLAGNAVGVGAALVFGIAVNNVYYGCGASGASNPQSVGCTATYLNTTGASLTIGVYFGGNGGGTSYLATTSSGVVPVPSCSLTIEEIL
jgi:hypothetical protein